MTRLLLSGVHSCVLSVSLTTLASCCQRPLRVAAVPRARAAPASPTSRRCREKWSTTDNVAWAVDMPGRGWSSPIVWRDRVFVTSAISPGAFKAPSTGIFGNDYVAELKKQGLPDEEVNKRVIARDIELTERDRRHPLHGLRARRQDRARSSGSARRIAASRLAAAIGRTPTRRRRR